MKIAVKYIAVIILVASAVIAGAQSKDSANQQRLAMYRVLYWDNVPGATGWVTDFDRLYSRKETYHLDSVISAFEKQTTIEIGIVTLDTFCTTKENFNALAFRIMNVWGVGKKDKNNGILISICIGRGVIRINNGDGIQKFLSDSETQALIDKFFIPQFKTGDYYTGTLNGVTALMAHLKNKMK